MSAMMDNNHPFLWDIVELAGQLRQERLFVNSQQSYIQDLIDKLVSRSSKLVQVAWITSQQRLNLNRLVLSCPSSSPAVCCLKAHNLELTKFIDARNYLGFQKCASYGELLSSLRESPELVARCLVAGDRSLPEEMPLIIRSVVSGLYASCVLTQDRNIVLKILNHLITLQIIPSEAPRRLVQQGSCAFARLYSAFHESLFPGKLYLTAALHAPVMALLMSDEKYLDIEPEKKVAERFPLEERLKRFGTEGSDKYKTEISKYKSSILKQLTEITQLFINSIHDNFHCFPNSVFWLVGQIYCRMIKANTIPEKEVFSMCADLVFTLFICPAIVTPETYGITDVPISEVARHNLMQVAQVIQMLALRKFQSSEARSHDIYTHFAKDCVSSLIDTILEGSEEGRELRTEASWKFEGLSRLVALFTEAELLALVSFLRTLTNESLCDDPKLQKELSALLSQVPAAAVNGHSKQQPATNISPPTSEPAFKKHSLLSKVNKNKSQSGSTPVLENGSVGDEDSGISKVLLIPFDANSEPPSLQKILSMEKESEEAVQAENARRLESDVTDRPDGQEKRTRFSLSHDEGSIGNTSDNLEVVSEAASNHSVASSLDLETEDQNDNLSDMVSANVSGRGSPNISGRDTPSSQLTEGEEAPSVRQPLDYNPPPPQKIASQQKFDIDDKFGKFELETLVAEVPMDTFSLVSDTWSTDVLASDSETVEQQQQQAPVSAAPLLQPTLSQALPELPVSAHLAVSDAVDTASEAWSTDVVISDSERLTEVDTDDTASVARSDDTGRSEAESRGDPDGVDEPVQPVSGSGRGGRGDYQVSQGGGGGGQQQQQQVETGGGGGYTGGGGGYTGGGGGYTGGSGGYTGGQPSGRNITGKGGDQAEYRRRTVEYVDSNRNLYSKHVIGVGSDEGDQPPVVPARKNSSSVSSPTHSGDPGPTPQQQPTVGGGTITGGGGLLPPSSAASSLPSPPAAPSSSAPPQSAVTPLPPPSGSKGQHFRTSSQQASSLEMSVEEGGSERGDSGALSGGCFSASSSTSGSSVDARHHLSELPLNSNPVLIPNGSAVLESSNVLKPTGAIPKSISFDKTAERGDKESLDEDSKHKRSFFRNFKIFKNRRGKSYRTDCYDGSSVSDVDTSTSRIRRGLSEEARTSKADTSDDILAKYRGKGSVSSSSGGGGGEGKTSVKEGGSGSRTAPSREPSSPCDIFEDAKKKLKLVLSNCEIHQLPESPPLRQAWVQKENELVAFLQLQLAEAINLQDRTLIPQLYETLRCVRMLNPRQCRKVFESLKEDYKSRVPYISYLVKCQQSLLGTLAHLDRLLSRIDSEKRVVSDYLVSLCVRLFLERRESQISAFISEFQATGLADEKSDLLAAFLAKLSAEIEKDPNWQFADEEQITRARSAFERSLCSRVYVHAMYPNGDGDISRDQVFQDHIAKLSKVVTPDHKDLRIPKMFHCEAPWLSAQAELSELAAYRSPRDKLHCTLRTLYTILNLLSLGSLPAAAADDLTPVLVYVIIMANPPSLLSTVEYVSSFYAGSMEGEEAYYWTQFCSAIEFIKTMDYEITD